MGLLNIHSSQVTCIGHKNLTFDPQDTIRIKDNLLTLPSLYFFSNETTSHHQTSVHELSVLKKTEPQQKVIIPSLSY